VSQGSVRAGTVEIVPLRRKHLRAVMAIEQQVYTHPWTHALFLSELALPASRVYVVEPSIRMPM